MQWRRDDVPGRLGKVVLFALVLEGRGRVGWFNSEGSRGGDNRVNRGQDRTYLGLFREMLSGSRGSGFRVGAIGEKARREG